MTDEAKALVERDTVCAGDKPYTNGIRDLAEMPHVSEQLGNVFRDCANIIDARNDLIETQAREIERLRAVLDNIAHESSDTWARRDACVALGIDWPETRRQP